ncbi:LPXTG cell wall anchor domain-containing protein [Nonlabens antarcticus]|uniref:LPXTG cell wall anchor domain-containing protein n=1 Tax=Nonlabens antarcticus TaxID=392714 RepID=UPI001890BB1B|nr:LPXTG cell wall anchor domain-containing protein [Nonlabens antarcticus]
MSKFFKYFEYAYLLFATLFIATGIYELGESPQRAYLMFGMAALAIFMFFFKRRFRRRFEERNKN